LIRIQIELEDQSKSTQERDALLQREIQTATHMAYADFLIEQGDPQGELIRTQIEPEDQSKSLRERNDLRQREIQLLDLHRDRFWGDLAPFVLSRKLPKQERVYLRKRMVYLGTSLAKRLDRSDRTLVVGSPGNG
jgi:uncharacterized protein (TIGR02996 family)